VQDGHGDQVRYVAAAVLQGPDGDRGAGSCWPHVASDWWSWRLCLTGAIRPLSRSFEIGLVSCPWWRVMRWFGLAWFWLRAEVPLELSSPGRYCRSVNVPCAIRSPYRRMYSRF
jgi:hypothetical protein